MEEKFVRIVSARLRPLAQRLEKLEQKLERLPESLSEKDGSKAMETKAQDILDTTKELKEETKLLKKECDQMYDREKLSEERQNSFEIWPDCNSNTVLNEIASCENDLVPDGTRNTLEPDDSPATLSRHGDRRFVDRATSPVKLMQSKFEVKQGTPTDYELEKLGSDIATDWMKLGRRLIDSDPKLEEIDQTHVKLSEKGYHMLKYWKQSKGYAATYQALSDALQHELVQRQDLAEKFCYIKGNEGVEAELNRVRIQSARVGQIVSDTTAGLEQRLEMLKEKNESQAESIETIIGFLNDIGNNVKGFEVELMELKRQRDQMNDREKMPEEHKKSYRKSSDCNNNTSLNETASCENELAADGTPNAIEPDDSPASLGRQADKRFVDRVISPVNLMQSKFEGNQICSRCHELKKEIDALNTAMGQLQLEHNQREAELSQTYSTINPVRVNELEEVIEKLREEKRNIESRLLRDKKKVEGELQELKKRLAEAQRKNGRLTMERGKLEEKKKLLKKKNEPLLKIKTGECDTSECDETKAERNRRPSSEIELLRKENEGLIKENKDSIQRIKDLEQNMNELKTINKNLSSKIKTEECETSECDKLKAELTLLFSEKEQLCKKVANADAHSLQKIEDLKTKIKKLETENNILQLKIREKKSEIERLQKDLLQMKEANADLLQKTKDLEKKKIALVTNNKRIQKLQTKESEKCKMLEEEVNKYKNAVSCAFLPSGREFTSPIGVLSTLTRDRSARLVATRSSEGPGEASDIFDHSKGKESGTAEHKGSWWKVDLGENHRLAITHYDLRHGKRDGESILRKWQLQGSIDGLNWMDLKSAQDPKDHPQFRDPPPYYTGRWSIVGEVRAFRYFRILQTGTNSAGKYGIYLSGLELYGILVKI